ncbi:riboflavin-specific deaminase [Moniliophthora roreri MCA 2997]|uniref:2,5-diamino-6-ribosylamino-4(3H)-pyrimidinone 5'-phosphate reductase n=1 Tax=Moniliophthora roreri (strain MCA 2997) TaxID=1381753 RepID=V2X0Q1_MONRO|nr:riboflavin-specific deaminase [Moniliophthora roreri MCA 2997]
MESTDPQPPQFLRSLLSRYSDENPKMSRPYVTLTFAQSVDAKIAGKEGKQLILSGKESMVMTHWMRTMHDAILIGIGTASNDNPQLNTRHLPSRPSNPAKNGHDNPYHLPRPIILDSTLRLSPNCRLLDNYKKGLGRRPWVFCSKLGDDEGNREWMERKQLLEEAGASVITTPTASERHDDNLKLSAVLEYLHEHQIRSLMVEGGARVIRSFFAEESMVDTIIVTIAPTFVGDEGVGYNVGLDQVYRRAF